MKTILIALSLTIVTVASARAADMMSTPADPGAHLSALVGSWSGHAQFTETGKPAVDLKMTVTCRKASGGAAVSCDAKFASPEMNLLETDLFGYDAVTGNVHWYAVTNGGDVHDHVGAWSDDSHLSVRHTGRSERGDFTEEITLILDSSRQMSFDTVTTVAGATANTIHGTLTRR